MRFNAISTLLVISVLSLCQLGMGRSEQQYDQEAKSMEKMNDLPHEDSGVKNPAKGIAQGVRTAAVDSTAGFISETASETRDGGPIVGTLEGARKGTGVVLDKTVKGAVKVATLGQGDLQNYEVEEPEVNSGEPTKVTIKIPGT